MRVIIGGMGLSGSTLCYNIFRIMADRKNHKQPIKIHEWNPHANMGKTIFMVRDLRDTIASMMRKDPEINKGNVEKASHYQMYWYYHSWDGKQKDFIWKYEDYKLNPYEYLKLACDSIGIPLTLNESKEIVDEAENIKNKKNIPFHQDKLETFEQSVFWEKTKLSKRHITNGGKVGGYVNYLSEDEVKFIEKKYKYFFEEHKYDLKYE